MTQGLREPLPANAAHLCIDMQRMFVEDTEWRAPWAQKIMPVIVRLCEARPANIWFTRFIPAAAAGDGAGAWARYWRRWSTMTLEALEPGLVDLAEPLQRFAPPARILDKRVYSPWLDTSLHQDLRQAGVNTLLVTGAETDVCVLAAVLGAVDLGYRVVVVTDAVCSSADGPHDNMLALYSDRFSQQVETADSEEVLEGWRP